MPTNLLLKGLTVQDLRWKIHQLVHGSIQLQEDCHSTDCAKVSYQAWLVGSDACDSRQEFLMEFVGPNAIDDNVIIDLGIKT